MAGIDQLLYGYDPSSQPLFQQDQPQPKSLLERILTETWPAKMAQAAYNAVKLPGDVYSGAVPVTDDSGRTSPNAISRSADLAALMQMGSMAAPAQDNAVGMGIRAYHGSPYDFDKFDLSKIGTGEGAQAYGHGLYFAENPQTAQAYRSMLAPSTDFQRAAATAIKDYGSPEAALAEMQARLGRMAGRGDPANIDFLQGMISELQRGGKMPGHTYEVNINADPQQMLPWDENLARSPDVASAISSIVPPDKRAAFDHFMNAGVSGQDVYNDILGAKLRANRPQVSQQLSGAGIPGIKYLDQGSRAAGDGSRNYVVFDPSIIDILRKYGLAGLTAGGLGAASAMTPDQAQAQQ